MTGKDSVDGNRVLPRYYKVTRQEIYTILRKERQLFPVHSRRINDGQRFHVLASTPGIIGYTFTPLSGSDRNYFMQIHWKENFRKADGLPEALNEILARRSPIKFSFLFDDI